MMPRKPKAAPPEPTRAHRCRFPRLDPAPTVQWTCSGCFTVYDPVWTIAGPVRWERAPESEQVGRPRVQGWAQEGAA